jgi:hypothetical protein
MTLAEMDVFWDEAKNIEREAPSRPSQSSPIPAFPAGEGEGRNPERV